MGKHLVKCLEGPLTFCIGCGLLITDDFHDSNCPPWAAPTDSGMDVELKMMKECLYYLETHKKECSNHTSYYSLISALSIVKSLIQKLDGK